MLMRLSRYDPEARIWRGPRRPARGLSLIELIVALVVFGIALASTLGLLATLIRSSADPMIQTQALALAQAYLDEALARDNSQECDFSVAYPERRDTWLWLDCYRNREDNPEFRIDDQAPVDHARRPWPGLEDYRVTLEVDKDQSVGPPGQEVMLTRVRVRITHRRDPLDLQLTAYRGAF